MRAAGPWHRDTSPAAPGPARAFSRPGQEAAFLPCLSGVSSYRSFLHQRFGFVASQPALLELRSPPSPAARDSPALSSNPLGGEPPVHSQPAGLQPAADSLSPGDILPPTHLVTLGFLHVLPKHHVFHSLFPPSDPDPILAIVYCLFQIDCFFTLKPLLKTLKRTGPKRVSSKTKSSSHQEVTALICEKLTVCVKRE